MRHLFLTFIAVAAIALAGCRTPGNSVQAAAPLPPTPYARIADSDTNFIQLQLAARKFVPANHRGPAIWLVGAMHLGEPGYYRDLQKFLDAQTVVLYEGINTDTHPRHVPSASDSSPSPPSGERAGVRGRATIGRSATPTQPATNASFSMQSALANALGLVFQLDAIDYDRTNFLNSDLSVTEIQQLMAANAGTAPTRPGQPASGNATFDSLLQVMDGTSFLGSLVKVGIEFIGASPKLQALTKLSLIEAVGELKGDFSTMRGMPPELSQLVRVLIQARNQHVIGDLKTELKSLPRSGSIAIFYGAGHLEDMQQRVTGELHYQPTENVWFTAFSVNFQKANLSPAEVRFTRSLVKSQMEQMQ
jgi:hypothetical protein